MNPTVVLRAGHTTATFDDRHPDARTRSNPTATSSPRSRPRRATASARRARPSSRSSASSGDAALPVVTLRRRRRISSRASRTAITVSLSEATSTALTINLAYGGNARPGHRLHASRAAASSSRRARPSLPVDDPDRRRQRRRVGSRARRVGRRRAPHYRVGSPSSAAVTISSQIIPEAHDHVGHDDGAARRRGDVHDPRRPGAGEGHVGQLPGRRHRAAGPGLRAAARHHAAAARARRR